MARIGIYGGSFNPPHIGHIQAARRAKEAMGLDRLFLIPAAVAPHKQSGDDTVEGKFRLEMLELSLAAEAGLECSDLELRRAGPSYTVDTVVQLRKQYPRDSLILLMGTDMFLCFDSWWQSNYICQLAEIAVMQRGGMEQHEKLLAQKEKLERHYGATVTILQNPPLDLSSTQVRHLLLYDCADKCLMPGVLEYIKSHGLYRTNQSLKNLPLGDLEERAISLLKPKRVSHVLGCRDAAVALARRYGADETAAARAGLLHDVTKLLNPEQQRMVFERYCTDREEWALENEATVHALTGSLVAGAVFGESAEVCSAIRYHTTGHAGMTMLEKIIYLADCIEPNRAFPGVETLRKLAFEDLDRAMVFQLEATVRQLEGRGNALAPGTLQALADLKQD